jgi:hypothetical protein
MIRPIPAFFPEKRVATRTDGHTEFTLRDW